MTDQLLAEILDVLKSIHVDLGLAAGIVVFCLGVLVWKSLR